MKLIISMILFLSIGNTFAQDKNPCAKDNQSQACKDFLNVLVKDYPCATDLSKYCAPKDFRNSKDYIKNANAENINQCLEKHFSELSRNCQKFLEAKKSSKDCMDAAMAKCAGLKNDKEIECMSQEQPRAIEACQRSAGR